MTNATNTTHAFFDLKDYVMSTQNADVAAQMAQSIAFAVDVNINNAARQLMKNLREYHLDHGIDSLSEMTAALEDSAFAEEVMMEAGKDELGPVATILQLNAIRDQWHLLASELTSMTLGWNGVPRVYEIKPIEEVLLREVKLQVKPIVEHRIKTQITRRFGDEVSKEDIETQVARRIEREKQKLKDISATLQAQQGALVTMYQCASNPRGEIRALVLGETDVYSEHEELAFHRLDASLRKQMIEAAAKGASRAEEFATSSSNISDIEFDDICFAAIKVDRELKAVLKSPSYAVQRAMESAV